MADKLVMVRIPPKVTKVTLNGIEFDVRPGSMLQVPLSQAQDINAQMAATHAAAVEAQASINAAATRQP